MALLTRKRERKFFFFFVIKLKQNLDLWLSEKKIEKSGYSFQEMILGINLVLHFVHKTEFIF